MPIYEYECTECKELHEALQKVTDDRLTDCPACGKAALRKKVSAAAFRLKGSGWYETDFKSGNKKNLAGDGGTESSSGATGATDKAAGDSAASSGGSKSGDAKKDSAPTSSTSKGSKDTGSGGSSA